MSDESELSVKEPEILKKAEYEMGLQFVDKGLWRTRNLAKALSVDEDTITAWKKTKRYQDSYAKAVMKFVARRKDVEVILREMDVDTPQEAPKTLVQINYQPIFGGKSADALPTNHSDTQDIRPEEEN
jgi:hypothetical protein